jgi:galactonate dehydratase
MRIEEIQAFIVNRWVVVAVHTDAGISGVGPAAFWSQPAATAEAVHRFRDDLLGEDPLAIESHWLRLYRKSYFRSAAICAALSAIDVALWDIAGKYYGAPVYGLLGGKHRDEIRMCALAMAEDLDSVVEMAVDAVKEGYTAVKIDPIRGEYRRWSHARLLREITGYVSAVRDAIGEDVDLCVEAHRKLSPAQAVDLARKLEPLDILFLEDPIPPDSIDSMAEVARKVNVPLATGERLHTIYEFKEVLSRQAAQDLKLDVGLQGGISQCKKIAALAEAHHATVSPHNAFGPVLTAAHVQLCAAIPNFQVLEYRSEPDDNIVSRPLAVERGYIKVPDVPGIGVELNEEVSAGYLYVPGTMAQRDLPKGP